MRGDAESQKKIVVADVGGDGGEAPGQRGEIQTAVVLMDLDGIATAHGHVGLSLAIKMEEFAADADGALGISFHADCAIIPGPDIERKPGEWQQVAWHPRAGQQES